MNPWILLSVVGCGYVAQAVEPWADKRLTVTDGLEIWLDASRENAARRAFGLREVTAGGGVDFWHDGSGQRHHLNQPLPGARPRLKGSADLSVVSFDGKDDYLACANLERAFSGATVFLVGAARSNQGQFRGFLALNRAGQNDYTSGVTIDLGPFGSRQFTFLNVEGAGFGGAGNLLKEPVEFGPYRRMAVTIGEGPQGVRAFVGTGEGERPRSPSVLRMDQFTLGARCYSNTPEPPHVQGHLDGAIAEVLVFGRVLADPERDRVLQYLADKYAQLPDEAVGAEQQLAPGATPLVRVADPPAVQMFVPGFTVRELPVQLRNINNVKYRADGKLVALGYDGQIHLLVDKDGDGLEETVTPFWDRPGLNAPIGMALTPPDYPLGEGVFVPAKGKLALIVDTNRDDVADREIIVAQGWTALPHGVDALGVALDAEGNVYFSLGTANFTSPYLVDPSTGRARYDLKNERGTILKVSADFREREVFCTGVRFPVALAFNAAGDLFCTDQEGATWLPDGNPLDELLHIQKGRHYGFPPRHPKHLPSVIDEPSVFDYQPQHQSTCGLNFNEPISGGLLFGPEGWRGDAIVTGYSRGKLFRTKLVRTDAGYVAQNQLFAIASGLPADAAVSPRGALVVAIHSGAPDWGSGPTGAGRLYQIAYTDRDAPQPVLSWENSPSEIRVAFDRPLDPLQLRNLAAQTKITRGRYVAAGDRFETLRPGYQVVQDQLLEPRYEVAVLSASLSTDRRTLSFAIPRQTDAVNYAVNMPRFGEAQDPASARELAQHGAIDLALDLTGVQTQWTSSDAKLTWSGWLPALDLRVGHRLTEHSAEHDALRKRLGGSGALALRGQLNLWQMLQPAIQPGSAIDYERPQEEVFVRIRSRARFSARMGEAAAGYETDGGLHGATFRFVPREDQWTPFEISWAAFTAADGFEASWWTAEDARPRAFPLRRTLLPWARLARAEVAHESERVVPELVGGDWARGKALFFGEQTACSKCHSIRGQGGTAGPDLSNLIHRDYASVLRDILEPNAAINPDHLSYEAETTDDTVYSGVLQAESSSRLVLADATGKRIELAKSDVVRLRPLGLSLMPEGFAEVLDAAQRRDLLVFLMASPLEPAPLEIPGAPAPRTRAELLKVIETPPPASPALKRMRILLVAGPKDHGPGEHDYPLWQKRWAKLLALASEVEVSTAFGWPGRQKFENADVAVFYSNNPGWSPEAAAELEEFQRGGGGLVYLHYAVDGHAHVEELSQRIGLAWKGGASRFRHGPLKLEFRPHVLARGFGSTDLVDESYWQLLGDPGRIEVFATGVEEGKPQPLFWTREAGRGRVFVSIPGHYTWTFDDPLFRILILRGIAWAAREPMDRLAELSTIGARMAP